MALPVQPKPQNLGLSPCPLPPHAQSASKYCCFPLPSLPSPTCPQSPTPMNPTDPSKAVPLTAPNLLLSKFSTPQCFPARTDEFTHLQNGDQTPWPSLPWEPWPCSPLPHSVQLVTVLSAFITLERKGLSQLCVPYLTRSCRKPVLLPSIPSSCRRSLIPRRPPKFSV